MRRGAMETMTRVLKTRVKCPRCGHEFEVEIGRTVLVIRYTRGRVEVKDPDEEEAR